MEKLIDENYYSELRNEIEVKSCKVALLLQEIELLRSFLKRVEVGKTREEIKAEVEHNPFDDFDFLGLKVRVKNDKR